MDDERVRFRVRHDATGGKRKVTLAGSDFIGRLLLHVLPPGLKRIRDYGLLAPAAKTRRLALAWHLLAMPQANRQAKEDAQAFMRRVAAVEFESYAHCKTGRWRVVQLVPPDDAACMAAHARRHRLSGAAMRVWRAIMFRQTLGPPQPSGPPSSFASAGHGRRSRQHGPGSGPPFGVFADSSTGCSVAATTQQGDCQLGGIARQGD